MKTRSTPRPSRQPARLRSAPATRETEKLLAETVEMNEALILGALRQHEFAEVTEALNAQLRVELAWRQATAQELSEKARLLDLSTDAIFMHDSAGLILYWSHGAEVLYGWPRADALGKNSLLLLHPESSTPSGDVDAELLRDDCWTGEQVHVRRDSQRITVLVRKALDRDAEGNPVAVLLSVTDITGRKEMEDELRRARSRLVDRAKDLEVLVIARTAELAATNQKMEAFVYSIAHDLRAPLRSMQGFSQLLIEEAGPILGKTARDYADRINHSAQFMDALLRDLLAFSRISQLQATLTAVDLLDVVQSVLSSVQTSPLETKSAVESVGPWPVVLAHEPTLVQVLFNLVSNALKFTAAGVAPHVRLRTEPRGDFIRVWVEDNGIGIDPDHQAQIFLVFTRLHGTKYPGTGIGLAIVQKGVERMGGRCGVESASGLGSRFWFELRKG